MSGKGTGYDESRDFSDLANHRYTVYRYIFISGPGTDDLGICQLRNVFHDPPADTRCCNTGSHVMTIIFIHGLESGSTSKYEGAMIGLMSVKVCIRSSQHLWKHLRFRFCYQRFDQVFGHWNIDSRTFQNPAAFIACGYNDLFTLKYVLFCNDSPGFSFYGLKLSHLFSCIEPYTQPSRRPIITKCGHQRIGMTIRGTPAGSDNFIT